MQGLTSVNGLASGLQTDEIISRILQIERRPIRQFQARQEALRARLDAFQQANTRLAALKEAADQLALSSFFHGHSVTSSQTTVVTASGDSGAAPGDYVITVESVARAHQILSQSYGDLDSTRLGTGTLTLTAAGKTTTIEVDATNNTLAGLRDAINAANSNVRASIVQDGDSSYRLLIASKETGTAHALTVTSTLSEGTAPTFADLQTAQDAQVKLGSGTGAVTVTRSTNTVRDLIPGVTLKLLTASPETPVTITVSQDTKKIQEGVQKLVDQYNNLVEFLNQQFKYDAESKKGGTLLDSYALQSVQNHLAQIVAGAVSGLAGSGLPQLGVTMGADGKLSLDAAMLESKLASDPDSVRQTLALTATSTHGGVQFVSTGAKTRVDGTAYAVEITQAARQARVTAGAAQTQALAADETLTVNGVSITLTAGMTQAQIIQAINARAVETGVRATATGADGTGTGNYLTLTSTGYGSAARVSVVSSRSNAQNDSSGIGNVVATAASPAGENGAGTGQVGLDVIGTINGEAATGAGQLLTGNAGNANTDGLRLRITADTPGSLGTIRIFSGIAYAIQQTIERLTDTENGPVQVEKNSLDQRIQDLQQIIDARELMIRRREEMLRNRFNQLEEALSRFQTQSLYLSNQLRSLR